MIAMSISLDTAARALEDLARLGPLPAARSVSVQQEPDTLIVSVLLDAEADVDTWAEVCHFPTPDPYTGPTGQRHVSTGGPLHGMQVHVFWVSALEPSHA